MTTALLEQSELTNKGAALLEYAKTIKISNANEYEFWVNEGGKAKKLEKEIIAHYAPSKTAAHSTHSAICAAEKKHLEMTKNILLIIDNEAKRYRIEQAKIQEGLEREARARAKKEAEDVALALAIKLESEGRKELAEKILNAPVVPLAPVMPQSTVPKVAGYTPKKNWKARITNEALIPAEYFLKVLDMDRLNQIAKSQEKMMNIPGVESWNDESPSYR